MRDAGYGSVPMGELIKVRDQASHRSTCASWRQGYQKLPLDQLIRVRDHGVTPEYVRGMREHGYALSIDDLVRARDHGVTGEDVREMAGLGYAKQPMDALIRVRDHGVTSEFAKDLKDLGYDNLSLEDLGLASRSRMERRAHPHCQCAGRRPLAGRHAQVPRGRRNDARVNGSSGSSPPIHVSNSGATSPRAELLFFRSTLEKWRFHPVASAASIRETSSLS